MSVAIIILTLNEIDGVKAILPKIDKKWAEEIVVVDGGSTDGTIEECKKLGFEVVNQKNKGHGGGILTGVNCTKAVKIMFAASNGKPKPGIIPSRSKTVVTTSNTFDQVEVSSLHA